MRADGVIDLRRGRVLRPAFARDPRDAAQPSSEARERLNLLLLLGLLPMFGQTFHYLIDVGPVYLLSKAWPFMTLPLVVFCLMRTVPPLTLMFLSLLAYVLGVTPLISMVQLGNGLVDGLTTTVKAWPLAYYFSLTGALLLLAPRPETLQRAFMILGLATFGIMILLWFGVPRSWYVTDVALSKMFIYETERGYRIYMPMFLGIFFMFLCTRYAIATPGRRWVLVVIPLCLLAQLMIYKQRTSIAGAVAIIGLAILFSLPYRLRLLGIGGALVVAAIGIFVMVSGVLSSGLNESLGASLSIRQNSFALATQYVAEDLARLVFGVGSATRYSTVTMADLFGDASFYLADIGWAGILFEYGMLGTGLIVVTHIAAVTIIWRNFRRLGDPLSAALCDYALFIVLTSAVYSVMFVPGELATITAISVYLARYHDGRRPSPA